MSNACSSASDLSNFDVQAHARKVDADGYTIVPDAIPADQISKAVAAMEEVYERERPIAERFGEQTANQKVVRNVLGKHRFFETFFQSPRVVAVCRKVLGDGMVLYDTTARALLPSGGREERYGFQVHVDREAFTVEPFKGGTHLPVAINVLWSLVDFTPENGATVIWPGTHRSLEVPDPAGDYPGFVRAVMPAGCAVMWDAATWHASGQNHSNHIRYSAIGFYQRGWVRGMISNEHVLPPEVRARVTPDMRRLLGLDGWLPDYSSVRALSPKEIDNLSLWEKEVIGLGIY
jgi:ectoine hydroxylase-related dioxygenase (phytanoyl-CoA dioxygenase family)